MPMPKTTGCHAAGRRTAATQASGKATIEATPIPRMIRRTEPASGESERAAGLRAFRTIRYSGEKAHRKTVQNSSQYGQTNGRGRMMVAAGSRPTPLRDCAAAWLHANDRGPVPRSPAAPLLPPVAHRAAPTRRDVPADHRAPQRTPGPEPDSRADA